MNLRPDEYFMRLALREAEKAFDSGEIPVGAVIVNEGIVIAKGHNQNEMLQDPTAHAELLAITAAAAHLESKWLQNCTLYVTLEPCAMCSGAIVLSRIPRLVFGAYDSKAGASGSIYNITDDARLNHRSNVIGGILEEECSALLKHFFAHKRKSHDVDLTKRRN